MVFPSTKPKDICVKLKMISILKNVHYCRYLDIYSKLMKYSGIFYKIRNKMPPLILKIFIVHLCPHVFYTMVLRYILTLVMFIYNN